MFKKGVLRLLILNLIMVTSLSIQSHMAFAAAPLPTIDSVTYDASIGVLVATGNDFIDNGGGTDVDASCFTITGEGRESYTLTNTPDVERDGSNQFTLTLSSADRNRVNMIINSNGTQATDSTSYNLAAADDWMTGTESSYDISDSAISMTVSNVQSPSITSATYDALSGTLVLTGSNFVKAPGASNDVDASYLTITGEWGSTYTLSSTSDSEITSSTSATLTLSSEDRLNVECLLNKNGTASDDGTTYNLAAADHWMKGSGMSVDISDVTNGVTVSNISLPVVNSVNYNRDTGLISVTANYLVANMGYMNDIDASTLTFVGLGGASYTLTDTSDVDVTSRTRFEMILSETDCGSVNVLLDREGTIASDGTSYNLALADNWLNGAATSINIEDTTNGITVSVTPPAPPAPPSPSTDNSSSPSSRKEPLKPFFEVNNALQTSLSGKKMVNEQGQSQTLLTLLPERLENQINHQSVLGETVLEAVDSQVLSVEMAGRSLKELQDLKSQFTLKTGQVTYKLPLDDINIAKALTQVGYSNQTPIEDYQLTITAGQVAESDKEVIDAVFKENEIKSLVTPQLFRVTLTNGADTVEVKDFNHMINRLILLPDDFDNHEKDIIALASDSKLAYEMSDFRPVPMSIVTIGGQQYASLWSPQNSIFTIVESQVEDFIDVQGNWAQEAIHHMSQRHIMAGVNDHRFEPNRLITRAEFSTTLVKALGLKTIDSESDFKDVSNSDWFSPYINAAVDYDLVAGMSPETFAPNEEVTLEQAMVILTKAGRMMHLQTAFTDQEVTRILETYPDGESLSNYAKSSTAFCLENGLLTLGPDQMINPQSSVTRAQLADMVDRLLIKFETEDESLNL